MTGSLEDKNFFIEIQILDLVTGATTSVFRDSARCMALLRFRISR